MPTPFYHLSIAEELLTHASIPEPIRQFLQAWRSEFLFGNVAPDVQVVSGQARWMTHFFDLPIGPGDPPAWEAIFSEHADLADAQLLPAQRAAFLAGYVCHLQADWWWVNEIFSPYFGSHCSWGTFSQRLYYHNVLRAYLDQHILPKLDPGMDACLHQAKPAGWLPFVQDRYLVEWRDLLYPQLQPGAATRTVEVFSSRQGISAPEYHALLASEERMQHEIFEHIPLGLVNHHRRRVLDDNLQLLSDYLAFTLHPMGILIAESESQGVKP